MRLSFLLLLLTTCFFFSRGGVNPTQEKEKKKEYSEVVTSEKSIISDVLKLRKEKSTRFDELGRLTKKAISLGYKDALGWCYFVTAEKYLENNQSQIAVQYAQLSQDAGGPDVFEKMLLLAKAYSKSGAFQESIELLENIINDKGISKLNKCEIFLIQSDNHIGLENYVSAMESLARFDCEYQQELTLAYHSKMAVALISTGKTEQGIYHYKQANSLSVPDSKRERNFRSEKKKVSEALKNTSNFSLDVEILQDSIAGNGDALQNLLLASSYFELGKIEEAFSAVKQFQKKPDYDLIDHREIKVIERLANHYASKESYEASIGLYKYYLELADTIHQNIKSLKNPAGLQNLLELEMLRKEQELTKSAMQQLMVEDGLKSDVLKYSRWAIIMLSALILLGVIGGYFMLKSARERREANMQLALRSLRTQMNPHFIFNALNSVNSFISENDQLNANKYLTSFSQLMRLVMENSEHDFIPLTKELEIIRLYMYLEHHRFQHQFEYTLEVEEEIDEDQISIPPMLVQPYIENAVWHGLRYKEEKGHLAVEITKLGKNLMIQITDDGIGRQKSKSIKTKHQKKQKSVALKNIEERLAIIHALNKVDIVVQTDDVNEDGTGTKVTLTINDIC